MTEMRCMGEMTQMVKHDDFYWLIWRDIDYRNQKCHEIFYSIERIERKMSYYYENDSQYKGTQAFDLPLNLSLAGTSLNADGGEIRRNTDVGDKRIHFFRRKSSPATLFWRKRLWDQLRTLWRKWDYERSSLAISFLWIWKFLRCSHSPSKPTRFFHRYLWQNGILC